MKSKRKVFSVIGVILFIVYFIVILIQNVMNMMSYPRNAAYMLIFSIVKNIILYGYVTFYLFYQALKKDNKTDKVLNIILIVIMGFMVIEDLRQLFSYITLLQHGYMTTIIVILMILRVVFSLIVDGLIGVSVFGLVLKNKKYPFKLFMILSLVGLGLLLLSSIGYDVTNILYQGNIRYVLFNILSYISGILFITAQVFLILVIHENKKEIQ